MTNGFFLGGVAEGREVFRRGKLEERQLDQQQKQFDQTAQLDEAKLRSAKIKQIVDQQQAAKDRADELLSKIPSAKRESAINAVLPELVALQLMMESEKTGQMARQGDEERIEAAIRQQFDLMPSSDEAFDAETQQIIEREQAKIQAGVIDDPVKSEIKDTFTDVLDEKGNIVGQRNNRTNRIVSNPMSEAAKNTKRPESPEAKLIFDKELIKEEFGEDSDQFAEINAKADEARQAQEAKLKSQIGKFTEIDRSINNALDFLVDKSGGRLELNKETGRLELVGGGLNPDPTGTVASAISSLFSGSDRKVAEELLGTIKANIGFDRLQEMRDASPTGGALGQVAIQELDALQASISSLSTTLPTPILVDHLQNVAEHYMNWIGALNLATSDVSALSDDEILKKLGISQDGE